MEKYLFVIGQGIGVIALIFNVLSYQQKTHKKILLCQSLGGLLFTLHFLLIGAYTGAVLNLLGAVRSLIYSNREKSWANKKIWPIIFLIAFTLSGILTWDGIFSLFPTVAMLLSTVVLWIENPKLNRVLSFPTSAFWLIYNISRKSYSGIATEIFISTSIIIGYIRHDMKRKEK